MSDRAPPAPGAAPRQNRWLAALVFVGALAPFLRGVDYPFINFDDPHYVFQNPHVLGGLTIENARWALTTGYESNWHPLTWLSLQLDSTIFDGKAAEGYRTTNLLLHAVNATLLFRVLLGMTGAAARSAVVAALFAVHPLRVESVIWVTERKDVLSTLFWLLAMLAYLRYTRNPGVGRYLLVAAALALGLMAKPMLVTLPFALLLLDYWPLRRFGWSGAGRLGFGRAVAEKVPLLVIVVAAAFITFRVQAAGESVKDFVRFPVEARLANAVLSYAIYVRQTVWPFDLAPFYPHGGPELTRGSVLVAAAALLGATAACVRWGRSAPYLPVGWFWFLGALVPVLGLVQVGSQARADRYTYVPGIGLAVLVVWGLDEVLSRRSVPARHRVQLALGVLLILMARTWDQVGHWRSDSELWAHTLRVTDPENAIAHENLGVALQEAGQPVEALPHLARGTELDPDRSVPHINLAVCLVSLGRDEEAIRPLLAAARLDPENTQVRRKLVAVLARFGRDEEALPHVLALEPDAAAAHLMLGNLLLERQFVRTARAHFERAAALAPDRAAAHLRVGIGFIHEGRPEEAERPLRDALRLEPGNDQALTHLGLVLWHIGRLEEATDCCRRAVEVNPQLANWSNLGLVLRAGGKASEADTAYAEAARIDPNWSRQATQFAMTAVTRGTGERGLFVPRYLALQACEATGYRDPRAVTALAAVEAAAGRFSTATDLLTRARVTPEGARNASLANDIDRQLKLYRAGKSLRPSAP